MTQTLGGRRSGGDWKALEISVATDPMLHVERFGLAYQPGDRATNRPAASLRRRYGSPPGHRGRRPDLGCRGADPVEIVLFGSSARGDVGPDSDLDFLVSVRPIKSASPHQLPTTANELAAISDTIAIASASVTPASAGRCLGSCASPPPECMCVHIIDSQSASRVCAQSLSRSLRSSS